MDLSIPYWGSHFIDLFEKHLWKGESPVFVLSAKDADALYRRFMESLLSISPNNEHGIDVAITMLEGKHGYVQDVERARRMLETSKTPDAKFYLGWCWARFVMRSLLNQLPWPGKENIEVSKMNLDEASEREGKG